MLIEIKEINESAVCQLFDLYAESMRNMQSQFHSYDEMKQAYTQFLHDFLASPNQLILVETIDGEWVSGLRTIETSKGCWFIEAVETKPDRRERGYGKRLIQDTISYLRQKGMCQITCQIARKNVRSQLLHTSCGFVATQEPSIDPWGEADDNTILYKYVCPQ